MPLAYLLRLLLHWKFRKLWPMKLLMQLFFFSPKIMQRAHLQTELSIQSKILATWKWMTFIGRHELLRPPLELANWTFNCAVFSFIILVKTSSSATSSYDVFYFFSYVYWKIWMKCKPPSFGVDMQSLLVLACTKQVVVNSVLVKETSCISCRRNDFYVCMYVQGKAFRRGKQWHLQRLRF